MVTHRLSYFSYAFFFLANSTCWPLIHFFLLANSTCWPVMIFFTGQLNVLACHEFFFTGQLNVLACHIFFYRPTQCVGLSQYSQMGLIGSCYSLSHMLGKYFLRCWPLTAIGNLTPSNSSSMYAFLGKTWSTLYGPCQVGHHLPNFFIFSSQWQYCLPNQVSNLEILKLDLLVVCTSNFSLIFLDLLQWPKP